MCKILTVVLCIICTIIPCNINIHTVTYTIDILTGTLSSYHTLVSLVVWTLSCRLFFLCCRFFLRGHKHTINRKMRTQHHEVNLAHNLSVLVLQPSDLHVNTGSFSSVEPNCCESGSEFISMFCQCHTGAVPCELRAWLDGVWLQINWGSLSEAWWPLPVYHTTK